MSNQDTNRDCDLCGEALAGYLKQIETPRGEVIEVCPHHTLKDCGGLIKYTDKLAEMAKGSQDTDRCAFCGDKHHKRNER